MGQHSLVSETEGLSTTGKFAAIVTGFIMSSGAAVALAPTASADILDNIAHCESGGNPTVVNASGHGGLFQFDQRTWASVGGKGSPQNATPAEQRLRASLLMAARGTQPWDASKSCWSGMPAGVAKAVPQVVQSTPVTPKKKPTPYKRPVTTEPPPVKMVPALPLPLNVPALSVSSAGSADVAVSTTGTYQVVKGNTISEIATAHGMSPEQLFNLNRHIVSDINKIYPNQVLRLQ